MSWRITNTSVPFDNDAWTYIAAVETIDGQILEQATRNAITNFVLGCKADSIWTAIKASCILSGARTRLGALVPLVGTAPTPFNFVDADYNRKTGLKATSALKYLNSNRPNNADGKDNHHLSMYCSENPTGTYPNVIGNDDGQTFLFKDIGANTWNFFSRSAGLSISATSGSLGFVGGARSNATQAIIRAGSTSITASLNSNTTNANNTNSNLVFRSSVAAIGTEGINSRLAFYSFGGFLNLTLLDARVTTLVNAFAAAIP